MKHTQSESNADEGDQFVHLKKSAEGDGRRTTQANFNQMQNLSAQKYE